MSILLHQALSDEALKSASIDELRVAYRMLREHHVAETAALISRRDDLTRRRDEQLTVVSENLAKSQTRIERANAIMASDQETIDQLGNENARLSEIIDFMRNHYSPIGGRSCALCVYKADQLVRYCAMHRWGDIGARILATRAADPADPIDPTTTDQLTDEELAAWMSTAFAYGELEGTYLRAILDELLDRRGAEAIFVEVDRQFQAVDCPKCDAAGADNCEEHKLLVQQWRSARAALCDLARIYRGYLRILNAPGGGDPR